MTFLMDDTRHPLIDSGILHIECDDGEHIYFILELFQCLFFWLPFKLVSQNQMSI